MGALGPDWSLIHREQSAGFLTPVLAFLSFFYRFGHWLRLSAYTWGVLKGRSLPGFTLSVGNLDTGGTGKTPAVIMLAEWAKKQGFRVAVISRGYGGRYKDDVLEVSDGSRIKTDADKAGDEPYLLAKRLLGIYVIISKKRYLAGLYANKTHGCDFFILDDGFQHLALKRDLDVVLIDAETPFGNGYLLPRGPLRETFDQLGRADAFIMTRSRGSDPKEVIKKRFSKELPPRPVFFADHIAEEVVFPCTKNKQRAEFLKGRRVVAFAGIARPEVFKDTLAGLGADVIHFMGFEDHHRFENKEIESLFDIKEKLNAEYLLTTEKDWVRLSSFFPTSPEVGYVRIRFELLSEKEMFFNMIKNEIGKKIVSKTDI